MVGFVIVLALGVALGAALFGPTDVVLGQDDAQLSLLRTPPSPSKMEVQSRIIGAGDGTATAQLVAYPPSPCIVSYSGVTILAESVLATSATCVEFGQFGGRQHDAVHVHL